MEDCIKDRCYGPCMQKHSQHQEPSADRKDVCQSRFGICQSIYVEIIEDELNVKNVEFTDDVSDIY